MNTLRLEIPSTNLGYTSFVDVLTQRAVFQPHQVAYTFLRDGEDVQLTYRELDRKARFIGSLLQRLGVAPGERALLLYPPGLEFVAAFFGCLYAGVVAVPAYPPRRNQSLDRLQAIVADSQAKEVLTTTAVWSSLERHFVHVPELNELRWLATDNLTPQGAVVWQPPAIEPESLAFLQYTSGSTGQPKGVMVSHRNLLHNCAQIYRGFGHSPSSRGVIWLPLYHDMGLIGGVLQPLYGGFPCQLMSPLMFLQKPLRWLEAISRYRATTSGGPNFAYDLCLRKITPQQRSTLDLSSWQVAFSGAEPIRAETIEEFTRTFAECGFRKEAFYPCYGMAETTLFITGGLPQQPPKIHRVDTAALKQGWGKAASFPQNAQSLIGCGRSAPDQQLMVVDPQTLKECQPSQVGELWIAGPSVTQGYWRQPERTQDTFKAYIDTGVGPFLRTGDLGYVREDGEVFVTGRLKDVIIVRGRNHYPQDIEMTVEKSHLAIRSQCSAAFIAEIDGNERLVVAAEVERSYLRNLDIEQVVADIRQAITTQHGLQVHAIALLKTGSIPKTSSGKIQRSTCRDKFLNETLNVLEEPARHAPGVRAELCKC